MHRDIKPANVFIGAKNELILGDFGLVFFEDSQHIRVSETFENVGSRDWMPGWAMGIRIEDIKPTFDVFSLGKILWSMTSGLPILQLWYFNQDRFNVENIFPNVASIKFANPLFKRCIVEEEKDCLPNAGDLLVEINKTIGLIESETDRRKCKMCGLGEYDLSEDTQSFGINPTKDRKMKIFICTNCGNVQLFSYRKALSLEWAIEQIVIDIIKGQMGLVKAEISRETSFINDLNLDSEDMINIVWALDDEFGMTIPEKIQTVGAAIDYIVNAARAKK